MWSVIMSDGWRRARTAVAINRRSCHENCCAYRLCWTPATLKTYGTGVQPIESHGHSSSNQLRSNETRSATGRGLAGETMGENVRHAYSIVSVENGGKKIKINTRALTFVERASAICGKFIGKFILPAAAARREGGRTIGRAAVRKPCTSIFKRT
jgi:hypothetical protein